MALNLGELIFSVGLEDSDFQQDLRGANQAMADFGSKASKVGKELSLKLTAPLLGLAAVSLKVAADFEVSSKKFAKAFEGAGDEAATAVERLNTEFGLAKSEATALLAFTGDLLKGFGATSIQALELAESTQVLAASLAAYNGVPVAEASKSITSALTGERDALKGLGIVISEEAVKRQLLLDGTEKLTGQELLLAKGQATLKLAYNQSSDAVASFKENQETAAFQSAKLTADLKDLGVEFGTILLPVLKSGVEVISGIVEQFSDMTEGQKTTILVAAAVVAAIGPVIAIIGTATTAIAGLSTAMAFLAANPIVLAVAGVASLGLGIVALVKHAKDKNIEKLTEQFGDLGKELGKTADEMDDFVKIASKVEKALKLNDFQGDLAETSSQVKELAKNLGLTEEEVVSIGLASEDLSNEMKKNLTVIDNQLTAEKELAEEAEQQLQLKRDLVNKQEESLTASGNLLETESEILARKEAQIELQEAINRKYKEGYADILNILESEKSQVELIDDQIAGLEDLSFENTTQEANRLQAIEVLKEARLEAVEEEGREAREKEQERLDFQDEWLDKVEKSSASRLELINLEEQEAIASANKIGADTDAIEQFYFDERKKLAKVLGEEKVQAEEKRTAELLKQKEIDDKIAKANRGLLGYIKDQFGIQDKIKEASEDTLKSQEDRKDVTEDTTDIVEENLVVEKDTTTEIEDQIALIKEKNIAQGIAIEETIKANDEAISSAEEELELNIKLAEIIEQELALSSSKSLIKSKEKELELLEKEQEGIIALGDYYDENDTNRKKIGAEFAIQNSKDAKQKQADIQDEIDLEEERVKQLEKNIKETRELEALFEEKKRLALELEKAAEDGRSKEAIANLEEELKVVEGVVEAKIEAVETIAVAEEKAVVETIDNFGTVALENADTISGTISTIFSTMSKALTVSTKDIDESFVEIGSTLTAIGVASGNVYVAAAGLAIQGIASIFTFVGDAEDAALKSKNIITAIGNRVAQERLDQLIDELKAEFDLREKAIEALYESEVDIAIENLSDVQKERLKDLGVVQRTEEEIIEENRKTAIRSFKKKLNEEINLNRDAEEEILGDTLDSLDKELEARLALIDTDLAASISALDEEFLAEKARLGELTAEEIALAEFKTQLKIDRDEADRLAQIAKILELREAGKTAEADELQQKLDSEDALLAFEIAAQISREANDQALLDLEAEKLLAETDRIAEVQRLEEEADTARLLAIDNEEIARLAAIDAEEEARILAYDNESERLESANTDALDAIDDIFEAQQTAAQDIFDAEKEYKNALAQLQYEQAVNDLAIRLLAVKAEKIKAVSEVPWYQAGIFGNTDDKVSSAYNKLISLVEGITIPDPVFLANGGIINPSVGGTNAVIGEAGSSEAVIPLNDAFFNRLAKAATGSTMGSNVTSKGNNNGSSIINVVLDGKVIAKSTIDLVNNKIYTIDSRSIR